MNNENTEKRPPVVVVVGHVDHGKTSLLDYIRKTNVVSKEEGGITQSIGAYEITHNNQRITFIDTPGHEAFSKMRVRGAAVADVAILVVAAEEGVKPQTKEAIKVLEESKTPFVVAATKIDKPNANVEKVKNDLMANGVFLEGLGGSVSYQGVSSKTGEGVNELLDLILLTAEVEDLKYNPEGQTKGIILESKLDSRRGITASLVLKDGKLKVGDLIATPSAKGKVKILENFLGERVPEIIPSGPAAVLGFESLPQLGEEFIAGKLTEADLEKVRKSAAFQKKISAGKKEVSDIRVLLKADVAGSLEALNDLVRKIPLEKDQKLEIVNQSVGDIGDSDVKEAMVTEAIIIGFRTYPTKAAENLAKAQNVVIVTNEIIYKLIEEIEKTLAEVFKKKVLLSELEVLAVFSSQGKKRTVGGRVNEGMIKNKSVLEIVRSEETLGTARITNLQTKKMDVASVTRGNECGLVVESNVKIEIGDKLKTPTSH